MESISIVLLFLLGINLLLIIWLIFRLSKSRPDNDQKQAELALDLLKSELLAKQTEGQLSLAKSMEEGSRRLDERMAQSSGVIDRRLALFGEIEKQLGELSIQAQSMENLGQNIQSLSDLLRPPKLRGNLGEMFLENLLAQILPGEMYETQYTFSGGERVDAIIRLGEKFLPIDSKFPLESFERLTQSDNKAGAREFAAAIKKQIDSIATKYLKPEEGSTDIAIMYIPSEAVYHEFLGDNGQQGFQYALNKKIIPSCPSHLYGFLASLSALYRQFGLDKDQGRLLAGLDSLSESVRQLEKFHVRIEGSLRSISSSLNHAREESTKMAGRLDKLKRPDINREEAPARGNNGDVGQ